MSDFLSRYEVLNELGVGGMGRVHLAIDKILGKQVALKWLRPEFNAHALREARLGQSLTHQNIVRVHDVHEGVDGWVISMEYVPGGTLKSFLSRGSSLPLADTVAIAQQVAAALDHAHGLDILHRDIKPSNIMLAVSAEGSDATTATWPPTAKLLDFGLGLNQSDLSSHVTVVGTPGYIAPELAARLHHDHRVDIFSLGVTVYETLNGGPPFPREILIRDFRLPPSDKIPETIHSLIAKAVAEKPADRWPSAGAFASALRDASVGQARDAFSEFWGSVIADRELIAITPQYVARPKKPSYAGNVERGGLDLLRRAFQARSMSHFTFREVPSNSISASEVFNEFDVVLSGGAVSNDITRRYFNNIAGIRYRIGYSYPDYDIWIEDSHSRRRKIRAKYRDGGLGTKIVEQDVGILSVINHPCNSDRIVIGCMGIHAPGTYACYSVLSSSAHLGDLLAIIRGGSGIKRMQALVDYDVLRDKARVRPQSITIL